jgi:hypothetical protein
MGDIGFLFRVYVDWSDRMNIIREWLFDRKAFAIRVILERRFRAQMLRPWIQ